MKKKSRKKIMASDVFVSKECHKSFLELQKILTNKPSRPKTEEYRWKPWEPNDGLIYSETGEKTPLSETETIKLDGKASSFLTEGLEETGSLYAFPPKPTDEERHELAEAIRARQNGKFDDFIVELKARLRAEIATEIAAEASELKKSTWWTRLWE